MIKSFVVPKQIDMSIIFFKGQDKWKCDCGNVRLTPCYHIEAAMRLQENETK